jgi:beta-lactamase class A
VDKPAPPITPTPNQSLKPNLNRPLAPRRTQLPLQDSHVATRQSFSHTDPSLKEVPPLEKTRLGNNSLDQPRTAKSRLEKDLLEKKRLEKIRSEKKNSAEMRRDRISSGQTPLKPPSPRQPLNPFGAKTQQAESSKASDPATQAQQRQELSRRKAREARLRDHQRRHANQSAYGAIPPISPSSNFGITPDPQRLLGNRPVAPKSVPQKPRSPMARALLYGIRLLILGVGIGAIAGTLLAVSDRANHPSAQASQTHVVTNHQAQLQSTLSSLSVVPSALRLGQEMLVVKNQIQTLISQNTQLSPGIFIFDPDTSNYLDVNGGTPFPAASIIKLPILVALFQDVDAGQVRLDETLTLKPEIIAEGSGDLQFRPVGSQYTVMETASKMITISDNTATNMLIVRLGGAAELNRRFQSWGLTTTAINQPLPDMQGTNLTSPKDMANLMAMLGEGKLVSMRSRDLLLDILRHTVNNSLLPSGIDAGATIAHKTGDIGTLIGDVGLIDLPNGKRYIAAVLVKSAYNDPQAPEFIRQVSRTVYQAMIQPTNQPTATGSPGGTPINGTPTPIPSISPQGNSGGTPLPGTTSESPHPLLERKQTQIAQP